MLFFYSIPNAPYRNAIKKITKRKLCTVIYIYGGGGADNERWTPNGRPSLCPHPWVASCVLVFPFVRALTSQRLWGNPSHLTYLASSLRDKHSAEKLHILVSETNSDTFTYDGIDLGAERVTQEIENYLQDLEKAGSEIRKLSIVGYSLGGLVARYTIGLLYSKGWFERIKPVNFTTFATPHLGVKIPLLGVQYKVFNFLGSRTLSTSGRQLFTVDTFRNTNRPILSVLADPGSIFMLALAQFSHRVLYANIINDRSAPYYTTSISATDPYTNLDAISINYLPDYAPNIINPIDPIHLKPPGIQPSFFARLSSSSQSLLTSVPVFALFSVLIPIGSVVFLINSGVQQVRSQKRIRLHEEGKAGVGLGSYRIPLMVENARSAMEGAFENMNARQGQQYLPEPASDEDREAESSDGLQQNGHAEEKYHSASQTSSDLERSSSRRSGFPTLALTTQQFEMIRALDEVGFRKYRVHISAVRHTHAAIIVRSQKPSFDEGKMVVRHWLNEEFEI